MMGWAMGRREKSRQDVSRMGGAVVAGAAHLPEHGLGLLQVKASGCNRSMVGVGIRLHVLRTRSQAGAESPCEFPQPTVSFGSEPPPRACRTV